MCPLHYRVLGPVDVADGDRPVHLPAGHQRAVLARLLIARGRPVTAESLIDAAWPASPPKDPRGALYTVLSRLRSALGEESITTVPGGYLLRLEPGAVDADRFEQLCEQARTAHPARAVELLQTARQLWRGPAYADHRDAPFARAEAVRWDRLRLEMLEDGAAARIACSQPAEAVEALREVLGEDPFRERAVELLMTALYSAGRAAEALACGREHRERLATELGLDPAPSLLVLESRILGHEMPAPTPVGPEPVTTGWADTSTTFVGRQRELAELTRCVDRSRLVTVTGVGGVGKTRLVAEALPQLAGSHGPVVVVELATAGTGQVAGRVARALGAGGKASSLLEDIVDALNITPLLLVLDNCEHLLEETTALTGVVLRRCPRVRVLATSRHRLGTASEQVLPLAPFADRDRTHPDPSFELFVDRYTRARPDGDAGPAEVIRHLCRRLDGLPLAIELAAARAAGLGVAEVDALLERGTGSVLPGLDEVVEWSLRLLSPSQRRLLALTSVVLGPFERGTAEELVARIGPSAGIEDLDADLAELVEAHLLVRTRRDVGGEACRMLAVVRSRAATLLEESGAETPVRSAHSGWVAGVLRRGAEEWAGGRAVTAARRLRSIVPDVVAALRWSLEEDRLGEAADIAVGLKLHLHWVTDVMLSDLVIEVGRRCARSPDPRRPPGVAAAALACAERGLIDPAQQLGRGALQGAPSLEGRLLAGIAMAVSSMYAGRLEDSAWWARTVIDDREVSAGHRADLQGTLALAACYRGEHATARRAADLALLGAQAAGAEAAHAFALYADGELLTPVDPVRGADRFREAARRADHIDAQHISQVSRLALFAVLVRRQQQEALDLAPTLLRDVRRSGAWPQVWTMIRLIAEMLRDRDRPAEAALLLSAADAAEGAPPLIAADIERGVAGSLREALGEEVLQGIGQVAAGLSPAQVLDRAAALVAELRR